MYQFAKVLESNGRQVLFMKNKTDKDGEEVPKLSIILHTDDECQIDVGLVFADSSDSSWDALDDAFEALHVNDQAQKTADGITAKLKPGMNAFEFLVSLKNEE